MANSITEGEASKFTSAVDKEMQGPDGYRSKKRSRYDVDIGNDGKDIGFNSVAMGSDSGSIPSNLTERYKTEMGPAGPNYKLEPGWKYEDYHKPGRDRAHRTQRDDAPQPDGDDDDYVTPDPVRGSK